MTAAENRALIIRLFQDVLNAGDLDLVDEIVSPGTSSMPRSPDRTAADRRA